MDLLDFIKERRSIRKYTNDTVSDADVDKILEAGRWAPSGLNNQPWRFAVIRDQDTKRKVAEATKYSSVVLGANVLIAVFIDNSVSYDRVKDVQAIGACIQNMLLEAHSLGLGACWLGQILANRHKVELQLGASEHLELMAVLAIGYPDISVQVSRREELKQLVFYREEA